MLRLPPLTCLLAVAGCDSVFGISGGDKDIDAAIDSQRIDAPDPIADAPSLGRYDSEVLSDLPVAYWKLDEAAGPVANNAIAGAPMGMYLGDYAVGEDGPITSQPNTAASLGPNVGVTSGISFGNNYQFTGLAAFSVEAWVKYDNSLGTPIVLDATDGSGWIVYLAGNDVDFRRYSDVNSGSFALFHDTQDVTRWRHIVATFDGVDATVYVNGASGTSAASPQVLPAGTATLVAGTSAPGNTDNLLRGRIDNIAIYAHALSAQRVAAHFGASQ